MLRVKDFFSKKKQNKNPELQIKGYFMAKNSFVVEVTFKI